MILRLRYSGLILILAVLIAACSGDPAPITEVFVPSATAGAIVPTRMATNTPVPTDTPTLTPTVTSTSTPATPIAEAVRELSVRGGPGSQYPVVANLSANTQVDILGISDDGGWYQVQLPDDLIGWVATSSALVNTYGNIGGIPIALAPTSTPTDTPTSTPTDTPTVTPSATSTDTPTFTPAPTDTATDIPPTPVISTDISGSVADGLGLVGLNPDAGQIVSTIEQIEIDLTGEDDYIRWQYFEGSYTDFVMGTTVIWGPGAADDYCGFIYHLVDNDNFYTVQISRDRNAYFTPHINGEWQPDFAVEGGAIRVGANEVNELVLTGSGNTFQLYINGELAGTVEGSELASGQNGLLAGTFQSSDEANCGFVNSWVWQSGDVVVSASPTASSSAGITPINVGDTVQGTINSSTPIVRYSFTAQAGDIISVQMSRTSGDLDSYIILRDSSGTQVTFNDDNEQGTTRDSYLRNFTIPADGDYIIEATRYQQELGLSSGDFTLTFEGSIDTTTPVLNIPEGAIALLYGDSAEGTISSNSPIVYYRFEAAEGDVIAVTMAKLSGDLDPFITLRDGQGNDLLTNDDLSATSRDAGFQNYTIPRTGTYVIAASRFQGEAGLSTGNFSLTLEGQRATSSSSNNTVTIDGDALTVGQTASGTIDDEQPVIYYTLTGAANQPVEISMEFESDNLDPYLIILAPDGREVARNDDRSLDNRNSLVGGLRLTESGTYTIIATRFNRQFGLSEGDFILSVSEAEDNEPSGIFAQPISYDDEVTGTITDDAYDQTYTFRGSAGDVLDLRVVGISDDLDTVLTLTDNLGNRLAGNDDDPNDSRDTSFISDFIVPQDGFYTILVGRYQSFEGTTTGDFELEVSLKESGALTDTTLRYGILHMLESQTLQEDGEGFSDYLVGDLLDDDDNDAGVQVLLTFELPPLPEGAAITDSLLDLEECAEIGESFDGLGNLEVYEDPFGTTDDVDFEVSESAQLIDTFDECTNVDVSEVVREAYANGAAQIQFRLRFDEKIENGQADVVIFPDPRLLIYFGS